MNTLMRSWGGGRKPGICRIHRASYDICLYLERDVHGFSRYRKYTLGADLRDGAAVFSGAQD
jgi:hypothetical protein